MICVFVNILCQIALNRSTKINEKQWVVELWQISICYQGGVKVEYWYKIICWRCVHQLDRNLATVSVHINILLCNGFCYPVSKYVNTNRERWIFYQFHQLWYKHQLPWARQFFLWLWKILRSSVCFSAGIYIPNNNRPSVNAIYCYRNIHMFFNNPFFIID